MRLKPNYNISLEKYLIQYHDLTDYCMLVCLGIDSNSKTTTKTKTADLMDRRTDDIHNIHFN